MLSTRFDTLYHAPSSAAPSRMHLPVQHAPSSVRVQEEASLLHVAAEEGNARALQLLCELAPEMIRSRDIVRNTALLAVGHCA